MNNPFDYKPDAECQEAFERMLRWLDEPQHEALRRSMDEGKMLGVLIAEDADGVRHTLYAFSGQLGNVGFHYPGFVEPVFDYLCPDGHFKTTEAEISRQNVEIARYVAQVMEPLEAQCAKMQSSHSAMLAERKEEYRLSKLARKRQRQDGVSSEQAAELIRQSQFEKAELARLKRRLSEELAPITAALTEAQVHLDALKECRHRDSEMLQRWLYDNFMVMNARGESRSLTEIFAGTALKIPPSGAGECCAPKLLQAAYLRNCKPVSMAEYWFGAPKEGELREHGHHYLACRGKCLPVLSWMTQGLDLYPPMSDVVSPAGAELTPEIVYEDERFVVVVKPSGMLSVEGRGTGLSVQQWLQARYGADCDVRVAHRLDRDTSGLLIATFGPENYKLMQSLFATRRVDKIYEAMLAGDYEAQGLAPEGRIELPLSADWLDRPRQRVDFDRGKESVTDYRFVERTDGRSRVEFRPHTGRTHQLRVVAASPYGLGLPIVGDRLYGTADSRLYLHARSIAFTFPADGRHYCFESNVPF